MSCFVVFSMRIPALIRDTLVHLKFCAGGVLREYVRDKLDGEEKCILDFGCGTGRSAELFSAKRYVGVDVDRKYLRFAVRSQAKRMFVATGFGALPFRDESFDIIFVCAVLHHLNDEDILRCLDEFSRLLRPGGVILAAEPTYRVTAYVTNMFMWTVDFGRHIRDLDGYVALLGSLFDVSVEREYRAPNLYNSTLLLARRRGAKRECLSR